MTSVQDKLLKLLVNKYENSKTYEGSNKVNQSFSVKPDRVMKDYYSDYADPDEVADFENSLRELQGRGWISLEYEKNKAVIRSIRLNEESIDEIRQAAGIKDKNRACEDEIRYYTELMEAAADLSIKAVKASVSASEEDYSAEDKDSRPDSGITAWYCNEEIGRLADGKKARQDRETAKSLLELAEYIISNDRECLERELSIRFFGNSKTFESEYRRRVCRLIESYFRSRDRLPDTAGYGNLTGEAEVFRETEYEGKAGITGTEEPGTETEADRLMLEEYGIYKNPSYVYIKGNGMIRYAGGKLIDIGNSMPLALSGSLLKCMDKIKINASEVMTVENLTSFHRINHERYFYVYTGGYHGRAVRQLIKRITEDNDGLRFHHFGDIDPDGFLIIEHLNRSCGVKAEPVYMGIKELDKYRSYTKPLTDNDRSKAVKLIEQGRYSEVLEYMLKHNIKLEQEIVAYGL